MLVRNEVMQQTSLAEKVQQHFWDFAAIEKIMPFSSPSSMDPDDAPDHLQPELIELQCDTEYRRQHQQLLPPAR